LLKQKIRTKSEAEIYHSDMNTRGLYISNVDDLPDWVVFQILQAISENNGNIRGMKEYEAEFQKEGNTYVIKVHSADGFTNVEIKKES